jgi:hypothetical protein
MAPHGKKADSVLVRPTAAIKALRSFGRSARISIPSPLRNLSTAE